MKNEIKFIERDDEIYYRLADGVKLILCALTFLFCAALFIGSLTLTDAEMTAFRVMLTGN